MSRRMCPWLKQEATPPKGSRRVLALLMIEESATLLGVCHVDESAYVGHGALLGYPKASRGFGRDSWAPRPGDAHFHESRGVVVGPGATIGAASIVGDGTVVHARAFIDTNVRVRHDVCIGEDAELFFGCEVSSRVQVGDGAWIGGFVCNDVVVGAGAVIFGSLVHRFVDARRGVPEEPPAVDAGAFIGMGAVVIGGVTVGADAYVAAGCVLTTDANPGRLYVGSPARDAGPAPTPFRDPTGRWLPNTNG